MDEKKVREAIELIKQEIYALEEFVNYGGITEEKKKKHIGLYNTAIEALEKQLPKKVDIMGYTLGDINFRCPVCKSEYICEKEHEHFYCSNCGQKLDWTVEA